MTTIAMMIAFSAVVSDAYVIKTLVWSKSTASNNPREYSRRKASYKYAVDSESASWESELVYVL